MPRFGGLTIKETLDRQDSALKASDKRRKETRDGSKGDDPWNEVWVGVVWVCTRTNIVCTFHPKTYQVRTILPEYVLGTYWSVLRLQKYCSWCCFVLDACGKWYYVYVTCMLWWSNTELCPYCCPTYKNIFWYILSTYRYVPVCTNIDFLYRSVLSTY